MSSNIQSLIRFLNFFFHYLLIISLLILASAITAHNLLNIKYFKFTTLEEMIQKSHQISKEQNILNKTAPIIESDPELGWKFLPNAYRHFNKNHFESDEFRTNRYRMHDNEPLANHKNVLVFGDSFVEGMPVSMNNNFTQVLEKKFSNINFLNFGISGYSNIQEYILLKKRLKEFKPSHIIFSIRFSPSLPENDYLSNFSMLGIPDYERQNVPFMNFFGKIFYFDNDFFSKTYLDLNNKSQDFLHLQVVARRLFFGRWDLFGVWICKQLVLKIRDELSSLGLGLSILMIPNDSLIHFRDAPDKNQTLSIYNDFKNFLTNEKLHFISLLEPFQQSGKKTMGFMDSDGNVIDGHWNGQTHALVADIMASELSKSFLWFDHQRIKIKKEIKHRSPFHAF